MSQGGVLVRIMKLAEKQPAVKQAEGGGGLCESTYGVPLAEAKSTGYGDLDAPFAS